MRFLCALAVAALVSFVPAQAADQPGNDTMMILDASGSMWVVVGGETKIAAARGAVRVLLEAWPAGRRLGLMAYGHRRKGDCGDIETIAPVGEIDAAALATAVDMLNPKGKTPIAESLTRAANDLKSSETNATILLVSDGIETCGGDPCAVAKALEESGVDFTAHVIGFDVTDPAAKAQLQCIADVSGGLYRDASDADGLSDSLKEAAGAGGGKAKAAPKEEEDLTQNLRGVMRLSAESDPLAGYSTAIGWTVTTPDGATSLGGDVGAVLGESIEPQAVLVKGEYGNATAEARAVVEAGKITRVDLNLNAGRIVSEAAQAGIPGSASRDWGQLSWQVFRAEDRENYLTYSFEPVPTFVLPEGSYILAVVKDEFAKAVKSFDVKAGDELNVGLQLIAGTLKFSAPDSYILQILTPDGTALGSINETEGERALNPGDYVLQVAYREGPDVMRPFTVKDGETVEVVVER